MLPDSGQCDGAGCQEAEHGSRDWSLVATLTAGGAAASVTAAAKQMLNALFHHERPNAGLL